MKKYAPAASTQRYLTVYLLLLLGVISCRDPSHFDKGDVAHAQSLIGLAFSADEIDTMYPYLQRNRDGYDSLRAFSLDHDLFPALLFDPLPRDLEVPPEEETPIVWSYDLLPPARDSLDLAFGTVWQLAARLRSGETTSLALTELYLRRIKAYDPALQAVITVTEDLALKQAARADAELAAGRDRGPLHGIPYGLKDLMAVQGYKTTWGASPYRDQQLDYNAAVVERLEEAGAVLVAKLSSGALARGDVWFDGQTKNPWDTLQGASGSSAGSGSATAAGLVGFSIGTETLGSITSPSTRNGVTGLRPTYGRVSRYGTMSLSWSMDKIGPLCRSALDCALVLSAIAGPDDRDPTTFPTPFSYDPSLGVEHFRIGYLREAMEQDTTTGAANMHAAFAVIKSLGAEMVEKALPQDFPFEAFDIILRAEAGAFFDALVRSEAVDDMVQQSQRSRANSLRQSRFIPAVEYIQANRHRRRLIESMHTVMHDIDVLVSPSQAKNQLMITNLTGHPALSLPTGLDSLQHPTSITLIGPLFGEEKILAVGQAYQDRTDHEQARPPLFAQ